MRTAMPKRSVKDALLVASSLLVCAGQVWAQVAPIEGGRALDSNYRLGSGGINTRARSYEPNRSNLVITGNVTGGHSARRPERHVAIPVPDTR